MITLPLNPDALLVRVERARQVAQAFGLAFVVDRDRGVVLVGGPGPVAPFVATLYASGVASMVGEA